MTETVFYIVGEGLELKDGSIVPKKTFPTTDLSSYFKENNLFIESLDEWTETLLATPALQHALKITLSVASDDDLAAFGPKVTAIRAADKVRSAKVIYEATVLEGQTEAVEYFSEAVTTQAEATEFLKFTQLNAYQFSYWIEAVLESAKKTGRDWKLNPVAAKAFTSAWVASAINDTKRDEVKKNKQYVKAVSWSK